MNGCLFFITMIYLLRWQLGESAKSLLETGFWIKVQKCLKTRDYRLNSLPVKTPMEERLRIRLCEEVRRGTLKLGDLESIGGFYASSEMQQSYLQGLLNSYITHLAFVLLVPLAIRLLLNGQFYFYRGDLGALIFAFAGFLFIATVLKKAWPRSAFAQPEALWDFVQAYLGDTDCGSWKPEFEELSRQSWITGIDSAGERKERLSAWREGEASKFDQRRSFLENCLGPAELVMTCFFGTVLLALPLLSHFRTLVPLT